MKELTNEQLIALYQSEENEETKNDIRDAFFLKNKRLPHHVARKFRLSSVAYDDLVGLANYGMLDAFNRFNPEKNVKFVTFGCLVMQSTILKEFRKEKKHIKNTSIETPLSHDKDGNSLTLADLLSDESAQFELNVENRQLLKKIISIAQEQLTEQELYVFQQYYLNEPRRQHEIAKDLNVSQVHVSRLASRVIRKLKAYFDEGPIEKDEIQNEEEHAMLNEQKAMVSEESEKPQLSMYEQAKKLYISNPLLTARDMADVLNAKPTTIQTYLANIRKELNGHKKMKFITASNVSPEQVEELSAIISQSSSKNDVFPVPQETCIDNSPKSISLSLENAQMDLIQQMIQNVLLTLQQTDTFDMTIQISKHQ